MQKINEAVNKKRKRMTLEDLTISDNFVFTRVMQNKKVCKKIVSTIMGFEVKDIEILETEKTLDVVYDAKSVRMDVYLKSEGKVINIEMQVSNEVDLPGRCRFYRSIMDADSLSKGTDYKELPESYIIFICRFDPYGSGKFKYQFSNYDYENDLFLGDKSTIIIYNANKAALAETKEERDLFNYICEKTVESDFLDDLKKQVELVKNNDVWKKEYMYLAAEFSDERARGKSEGKIEGLAEGKIEGLAEGKIENAKNLLDVLDDETIAKKIGLDIEVVEKLRKNN